MANDLAQQSVHCPDDVGQYDDRRHTTTNVAKRAAKPNVVCHSSAKERTGRERERERSREGIETRIYRFRGDRVRWFCLGSQLKRNSSHAIYWMKHVPIVVDGKFFPNFTRIILIYLVTEPGKQEYCKRAMRTWARPYHCAPCQQTFFDGMWNVLLVALFVHEIWQKFRHSNWNGWNIFSIRII